MSHKNQASFLSTREHWAQLRFSIIGPLLHSPPAQGELPSRITELAAQAWRHPGTQEPLCFSAKSIERWYYIARTDPQPIVALERKVPKHAGTQPSVSNAVAQAVRKLRNDHPTWSAQLLYDNAVALSKSDAALKDLPCYATICRFLKYNGLGKRRRPRRHEQASTFVHCERRLFEVRHVNGLWHCDFHLAKRKVLTADAVWEKATLFAVLDDRSRLVCHLQWYVGDGNTEDFIHGLSQAFSRRGLPRALLSDNGGPMLAAETQEGLRRRSVEHHTTLPQTPEQNGKQEVFFSQIEGRLMPMLEGEKHLTLELLNRATFAWVEEEYQRHLHSETNSLPWSGIDKARQSIALAHREKNCAAHSAQKCRASSDAAMERSPYLEFASRYPRCTERLSTLEFASHAGICRRLIWSTQDAAHTSPRYCLLIARRTPSVADGQLQIQRQVTRLTSRLLR